MSDAILGYDCQGEALRAGDRVVVVEAYVSKELEGTECTITGLWPEYLPGPNNEVDTNIPHQMPIFHPTRGGLCQQFRKVNSGRDVFEQARDRALTEGNPDKDLEHLTEESITEDVRRAACMLSGMPWEEPGRMRCTVMRRVDGKQG